MPPPTLATGDAVVLLADDDAHLIEVPALDDTVKVKGLGVLSGKLLQASQVGARLELGRRSARLLRPTPELVFQALSRGPQVIRPQDAARIAYEAGIGPGTTVVEGGLGTGALTTYLSHLVGEAGTVHGFEVRKDHAQVAIGNLRAAGLLDRVEVHEGDLVEADIPCEAFLVDVPDPELVIPAAERCLVPGGRVCFYTPVVEQMEAVVRGLREAAFARIRSFEQLERGWVIHDRGARPSFEMLGHTGFLTVATRVADEA